VSGIRNGNGMLNPFTTGSNFLAGTSSREWVCQVLKDFADHTFRRAHMDDFFFIFFY
jgi:hypothetical protein